MSNSLALKIAWVALLVASFLAFSFWYGGNGKPITPAEGAALLQRFDAIYPDRSDGDQSFRSNIEDMLSRDDGKEFYAVNLEQLKQGEAAAAADAAYTEMVVPLLLKRAGHPVFVSERAGLMLGDYGKSVDRVAVVRYRSLRDMIEMSLETAMQSGQQDKFAALDHTEVFITRPTITFMQIRFVLAIILILIGWIGLKLISLLVIKRTG